MMTHNSTYDWFISAISDHLAGRETTTDKAYQIDELYRVSSIHQVTAVIYAQSKINRFMHDYLYAISTYVKRKNAIEIIKNEFRKYDIEFFFVKGPIVAQYYPVPELRTMGDIDIVVHPVDRMKAKAALETIGFVHNGRFSENEWHFRYGILLVELHTHLVYKATISDDKQRKFFNECWKYVESNRLNAEFHFLYMLFHLRKHFLNNGVGFRQFMDIAVMEKQNLNWVWIADQLKELGMWTFSERVFTLTYYWFGITPPICISELDGAFCEEATEMILQNGVFGFANEKNMKNTAVNNIRSRKIGTAIRAKRALDLFFLKYSDMITMPQYSYLKRRLYLLPVAWGHRAIRTIRQGRVNRSLKGIFGSSFVSKKSLRERTAVLEKWGL